MNRPGRVNSYVRVLPVHMTSRPTAEAELPVSLYSERLWHHNI